MAIFVMIIGQLVRRWDTRKVNSCYGCFEHTNEL